MVSANRSLEQATGAPVRGWVHPEAQPTRLIPVPSASMNANFRKPVAFDKSIDAEAAQGGSHEPTPCEEILPSTLGRNRLELAARRNRLADAVAAGNWRTLLKGCL